MNGDWGLEIVNLVLGIVNKHQKKNKKNEIIHTQNRTNKL